MVTSVDVPAPSSPGAADPPLPGRQAPAEQDAPHLPWKRATGIVLVILGLIGMGELGRLLGSALVEAEGALQSRSPGELGAVTMLVNGDRWDHWEAAAGVQPGVEGWLALYVLFDVVFVAGYGGLLWMLLRRRQPRWRRRLVQALVVVELVENVLLLVSAARLREGTADLLTGAAALASGIKWLLVAGVLIAVVAALRERGGTWAAVRGAGRSLRVHRLSVLMVVLLGALSLLPLPNLWDQFPDVLRGWFADTDDSGVHFAWGVVAYVVGAAAVFVLGRQRSERSWAALVGPGEGRGPIAPTIPPSYAWWVYGPLAALGTGLLLLATVGSDAVDERVWITLMVVPAVLVVASVIVRERARKQGRTLPREQVPAVPDRDQARRTWVTGDLLASSVLAIGALACVRALLVPVVLGGQAQVSRAATLVIALVLVLGLFRVAAALLHDLDTGDLDLDSGSRSAKLRLLLRPSQVVVLRGPEVARSTDVPGSRWSRVKRWLRELLVPDNGVVQDARLPVLGRSSGLVTWAASMAFLVLVLLDPVGVAETLGVVGTAVLTLTAWTVALGYLIVHLQSQRPLEVFSLLHLRANPILSLLAAVALLASMFGGVEHHHELREDAEGTVRAADRDTIAERVAEWADTPACTAVVEVAEEDVVVRPMVLVAASGGGIRAAAWAAGVVDRLAGEDGTGCGPASVLLSSGVSGGSVGLVVARGSDAGAASDTVDELAGESALSVAIGGLLVGDLVAGVSGLLVPSASDEGRLWRDRAGLMESVWERDATVLAEPYDLEVTSPTGALVLNSTSATGCRVLISQLELEAPSRGRPWDDAVCRGAGDDLPAGLDLWSVYRGCLPGMSWATAAMLSARFPTVTPAGWVPGDEDDVAARNCADLPEMQLIDGGYAESSGLGTLVDIAPSVVAAVGERNARTTGDPVIVPIVLHLEDEPRTEIARDQEDPTPELFVPVVGRGAGGVQMSSSALLQRASAAYAHPCGGTDDACRDAVEQVRATVADGVVVAAPATRPAVQAPLGWTLSPDSRTQLDEGLRALLDEEARGVNGYGSFRDLLGVLTDASHAAGGSSGG